MKANEYFLVENTSFTGKLNPDIVQPKINILKNEERSIDGTMNISIIAKKTELEVIWSFIEKSEMTTINEIADSNQIYNVTFIDPKTCADITIRAYVNSFEYKPYFVDGNFAWKDVKLNFCEI